MHLPDDLPSEWWQSITTHLRMSNPTRGPRRESGGHSRDARGSNVQSEGSATFVSRRGIPNRLVVVEDPRKHTMLAAVSVIAGTCAGTLALIQAHKRPREALHLRMLRLVPFGMAAVALGPRSRNRVAPGDAGSRWIATERAVGAIARCQRKGR